jgi:hypothetical protein
MSTPDYASIARVALGAATTATDPLVLAFYLGTARIALVRAKEEIAAVEHVLLAREAEMVRVAGAKQLALASEKSK